MASGERTDALRRDPDYRLLFGAVAVSQAGSQITLVALPLLAVLVLRATPFEMGLLLAVEHLGFLLVGLPAGVWVDRLRHRPMMITADLVRAVLIASIPVAAVLDVLSMPQLYVVGLFAGVATVFFDVAYQSHVPAIVGPRLLAKGNGQLAAVGNLSQLAGPGAAGWLVQLLSAPVALVADAVSYLVSGVLLARIRKPEARSKPPADPGLARELMEGLRFVFGDPMLRIIMITTGMSNLFGSMTHATAVIFLIREVGVSPGVVGTLLALGAAGGVAGSLVASRVLRRVGTARAIWLVPMITWPFALLQPLTEPGPRAALFSAGMFMYIAGGMIYNVAQLTYRQTVTPARLLGRMNATIRFVVWGVLPIGALIGGTLAELLGVRTAIWIAAAGGALAFVPPLLSPLRRMRDLPAGDPGGRAD